MNFSRSQAPNVKSIEISGVPEGIPESKAAIFRSRLDRVVREFVSEQGLTELSVNLRIGVPDEASRQIALGSGNKVEREEPQLSKPKYISQEPLYTREFLIVSDEVRERLESAIQILELKPLLFETWGLREIEPSPRSALNFHGPPGTGKTLAAHAIAAATKRRIICASYADIESMYHGEGPKNVADLFRAAESSNAVLFIDEADSLLSKRLTNVTQGSEQAINSMRSQLLICLDNFKGLVVFATNLVSNYDQAFDTRVKHVHFPAPDKATRLLLWKKHLPEKLPVEDLSLEELADSSEGMVGRDIKMAVIDAAVSAARAQKGQICQMDFLAAIEAIGSARQQKEPSRA